MLVCQPEEGDFGRVCSSLAHVFLGGEGAELHDAPAESRGKHVLSNGDLGSSSKQV
jgi:hypothetical protein